MNHFTQVVLCWLLVAAVAVLVATVAFGAWRVRAGKGTRKLPPRGAAVVLGEYAARARERLTAAFRDSEYEEVMPADSASEPEASVPELENQPRPGTGSPAGPGPSTSGDQPKYVPGEASHVHARQEEPLRSPGGGYPELEPPTVSATLLPGADDVFAIVTRKPVNPFGSPPAFRQDVPRPRYATPQTSGSCSADGPPLTRDLVASPGPERAGFWPVPFAPDGYIPRTMARDHDDTDIISQPRIVARRDVATRPYGFGHMLRSAPLRQLEAGVW